MPKSVEKKSSSQVPSRVLSPSDGPRRFSPALAAIALAGAYGTTDVRVSGRQPSGEDIDGPRNHKGQPYTPADDAAKAAAEAKRARKAAKKKG